MSEEPEALKGVNRMGIGGNEPPEPIEPPVPLTLQEQLAKDHADLVKRIDELMVMAAAAPLEVNDEETFKPLSDLLKAGRVAITMSEAARKIENEESRRRTAMIDAWFKNPAEKLTALMKAVKERTDVYLENKKAAEEKRRKDEAAKKAAAAEDKRWDAIWADARAELAIYDARKAEEREVAARHRKEAELRRADHLKNRGKRLAKVEPYLQERAARVRRRMEAAAAKAAQEAADERERLEREGEHRLALEAEDARQAAAVEARRVEAEKTKAELEEAKKSSASARREETAAGKVADKHIAAADEHADQAEDLAGEAGRLGKRAERADRHANASPASMSSTRSEMGTQASLSRSWKMTSIDRSVVDLNMLRGFLHPDAIDVAARGYMMAHKTDPGGPKLEGCTFEQVEEGAYR